MQLAKVWIKSCRFARECVSFVQTEALYYFIDYIYTIHKVYIIYDYSITFKKTFTLINSKLIKDKRKHHDAMDIHSLEQQFYKSDMIAFVVWSYMPSTTGSYNRQTVK